MTRHQALFNILITKSSDFDPWGEENRETSKSWADCSCGCKFYHPLEGKEGADWGVCFNPNSPRAGLLTFEHQGCQNFKIDSENEELMKNKAKALFYLSRYHRDLEDKVGFDNEAAAKEGMSYEERRILQNRAESYRDEYESVLWAIDQLRRLSEQPEEDVNT